MRSTISRWTKIKYNAMNDDCDDGDGNNGYGDDNDDPQLIIHTLTCINVRFKCKNILSSTLTSK